MLVLLLIPFALAIEVFRFVTRRRLVEAWVQGNRWTLRRVRYRFEPLGWDWLVYYRLEATDADGCDLEGVVQATGFIRRRVGWADRATTPSP